MTSGSRRWVLNYQPDAPDNIWPEILREEIKRLRTCSVSKANASGSHNVCDPDVIFTIGDEDPLLSAAGQLPSELNAVVEQLFAVSSVTYLFAEGAAEDGFQSCPVAIARRAVEERRMARGPMVAHAQTLALSMQSSKAFCKLVSTDAHQEISRMLLSGSSFLSLAQFQAILHGTLLGKPSAVHSITTGGALCSIREWVLNRFVGNESLALHTAWLSKGMDKGTQDCVFEESDWLHFLAAIGWPASEIDGRIATRAFADADWRGQGRTPASEMLFSDVHISRRWLSGLGTTSEVHRLMDKYMVHRTKRQRKSGVVTAAQWISFLLHSHWPHGEALANSSFTALDTMFSGEVKSALLIGPM